MDIIYIGSDLPDEYIGSKYTHKLMGTLAKAKANAAQGIPELLETTGNMRFMENRFSSQRDYHEVCAV